MPWGRLDDSLYDHPKLDLLPPEHRLAGVGLWARAISWANRFLTDGLVPRDRIAKLDGTVELADMLVVAGLFDEAEDVPPGHYRIHDFLQFNDSRERVLERRQNDAKRKAEWRASKDAERQAKAPKRARHSGTSRSKASDVTAGVTASVQPDATPESQPESQRDSRARESRPDPSHVDTHPQPPRSARGRRNGTTRSTKYAHLVERDDDEATVDDLAALR